MLAQFLQTGIGSFGEGRQEGRFLLRTDDAWATTSMRQGLEGTGLALSAQQVLQPAFRNLEASGQICLRSLLGQIGFDDPNA